MAHQGGVTLVAIVVNAPLGALFRRTPFSGCAPFAMLPSSFDLFRNQKSACKTSPLRNRIKIAVKGTKNSKFVIEKQLPKALPHLGSNSSRRIIFSLMRRASRSVAAICGSSLSFS